MPRNSTDERSRSLLIKELEHIQAILGRYDTFFFVSKNVFVATVSAIILYYARDENINGPKLLALAPIITIMAFLIEYLFRYFYWSGYILRIKTIRNLLQKPYISPSIKLYAIKEKCPRKGRLKEAFQWFDVTFYGAFLLAFLLHMCLRWVRFEHAFHSLFSISK